MHPHGFIRKAGVGSLLLLLFITALVVMEPLGVPRQVVVRQRHDAWVLAYPLGKVETLLQVVSPIDEDTEAHYYSLIAHQGQRVHVDLHAWASRADHPSPPSGNGRARPLFSARSEPSRMEEGDMRRAGPARSSLALQVPVRGDVSSWSGQRSAAPALTGSASWKRVMAPVGAARPLQQIDAASLLAGARPRMDVGHGRSGQPLCRARILLADARAVVR